MEGSPEPYPKLDGDRMKFFLKKGRIMVSGAAYAVSNENTGVVAVVPSGQKIHSAIRQLLREFQKEQETERWKRNFVTHAWSFADRVSEKVLPHGKCPLWYRKFLTNRCYEAVVRSTRFFDMEKDPAMGYELKLTLKKNAKF
jgi:hypothetical protein